MTQSNSNQNGRIERMARLRWVPIAKMKVSPSAQRKSNPARIDYIAADFDLEQLGTPTVSLRDGWYYIIDGQHRILALKKIGWGDQQVQCWCYEDLTEEEEAEKFLRLNDTLTVNTFSKFVVAVQAGRPLESDIDRVVRSNKLVVSRENVQGAISCVGTLVRVAKRSDTPTLGRALRIIRDAYGDPGLQSVVVDGVSMLCQRYNGQLDEPTAITKLGAVHGGVNGLLGEAERIRAKTGHYKSHCVAAAAVEIINRGNKTGSKLTPWWR